MLAFQMIIYTKITNDLKMRNYLAEQVLNREMLLLTVEHIQTVNID